jgi:hypothetical protein
VTSSCVTSSSTVSDTASKSSGWRSDGPLGT